MAAVDRDQPLGLEPADHLADGRAADLQALGDAGLDDVDVVLVELEDALAVLLERWVVLSGGWHGRQATARVRSRRVPDAASSPRSAAGARAARWSRCCTFATPASRFISALTLPWRQPGEVDEPLRDARRSAAQVVLDLGDAARCRRGRSRRRWGSRAARRRASGVVERRRRLGERPVRRRTRTPVGGDRVHRHAGGDRAEHREQRQLLGRRSSSSTLVERGLASRRERRRRPACAGGRSTWRRASAIWNAWLRRRGSSGRNTYAFCAPRPVCQRTKRPTAWRKNSSVVTVLAYTPDAQAGDVDALADHPHGDQPRRVAAGERGDAAATRWGRR